MYKINYSDLGKPVSITRLADGASIPIDLSNSDFRDFLDWNAKQNPPLDWRTPIAPTPPSADELRVIASRHELEIADLLALKNAIAALPTSATKTIIVALAKVLVHILISQGFKREDNPL